MAGAKQCGLVLLDRGWDTLDVKLKPGLCSPTCNQTREASAT